MMTVLGDARWCNDGYVDGVVRDTRTSAAPDGLLRGAIVRMGDTEAGPVLDLSIGPRRFPRTTPVHMHKSDTFRMALTSPLRVAGSTYRHGEFRLQRADTFYGPEYWTDDVGTNQLLLVADRRGVKPYLTDLTAQRHSDVALDHDVSVEGITMHSRDAAISQQITNNFGARVRGGYFDAGFTDTSTWPRLSDGTSVGVIALGDPQTGPLVMCWDVPSSSPGLPAFRTSSDILRVQVTGSSRLGDRDMPTLGFRLQRSGGAHPPSVPGSSGSRELWVVADRRGWPSDAEFTSRGWPHGEVTDQVRRVVAEARARTGAGPA